MLRSSVVSTLLASALALGVAACDKKSNLSSAGEPAASGQARPAEAGLTRIEDPALVCMVNDRYMGQPQIPVEVDGATYYGCCEGCKARLAGDPKVRTAMDPVTGEPVDKAKAVIGRDEQGRALYFASEATFSAYAPVR